VPCLLEPPGELRLRAADEPLASELLVDPVRDRRGATERLDLAGLLHGAERLDDAGGLLEVDAARPEAVGVGERDVGGLDGDPPPREPLGERRQDEPRGLLEGDALDGTRGVRVAKVGVEGRVARRLDEERGVRALEAGQVLDVDEPRDEQGVVEPCREALDPVHPSLRSASSASARR
jgi:hypothetical protein